MEEARTKWGCYSLPLSQPVMLILGRVEGRTSCQKSALLKMTAVPAVGRMSMWGPVVPFSGSV